VGVCAACLDDSHCSGVTPVCSKTTRTCVACTTDGAPSCPDPERPACQRSGPLRGACTECTSTNGTLCGGVKPVCLPDLGICGCAADDRACGAADSGLVCSGPGGVCVPGCGTAPRNGCPTGQTCVDVTSGVGQCSGGTCQSEADCHSPLDHCDQSTGPNGRCVQCVFDTDCDAPLICDPTKKTCVECTVADTTACRDDLHGERCLTDGRCGCTADDDCGSVTSGRVCDTTTSRCVPGCRGTGGNGCAPGDVCSSTTGTPGRCDPGSTGGDGGAGDGGTSSDGGTTGDGGNHADGPTDVASTGAGGGGGNTGSAGNTGNGGNTGGGGNTGSAGNAGNGGNTGGGGNTGASGNGGGAAGQTGAGGMSPTTDGSTADARDAGATDGPTANGLDRFIAGGGCHCATAPGTPNAPWLSLLLALVALTIRRRRH
jgi:MYXO-CTERM domain-containing protein